MLGFPTKRFIFPSDHWLDVSNTYLLQAKTPINVYVLAVRYFSETEKRLESHSNIQYITYGSYTRTIDVMLP